MIKLQQSEALTSHSESFWSIVYCGKSLIISNIPSNCRHIKPDSWVPMHVDQVTILTSLFIAELEPTFVAKKPHSLKVWKANKESPD